MRHSIQLALLLSVLQLPLTHAQTVLVKKDTVDSIFRQSPSFTIFKDNYFITGAPLGETPTSNTADAKFQISFKQRLLDRPLAFGVFAHIIFTQKSFWDIYRESLPFRETNYNPGLLFAKPVFKNDLFTGVATLSLEHESNGRDSIFSRSLNYFSAAYAHFFSQRVTVTLRTRLPFKSKTENNPDLLKYVGYFDLELHLVPVEGRLFLQFTGRKGGTWDDKGSVQIDLSFKPSKRQGNQYFSLQWFYGYAENLIDYRKRTNMLRIGLMFKPRFHKFY